MRSYIERAKDFIAEVFPYIGDWFEPEFVKIDIEDYNCLRHRNVQVKHGLSRIALITSDYVVKYDFDPEEVKSIGGCETELNTYIEAVKDGFGYLFAAITPYYYKGHNFYIMPRIRGISESHWHYADHYMTEEEQDWCDEHNLSDLHCNNYGFRNGKVCLIDYACTCEEESSWS